MTSACRCSPSDDLCRPPRLASGRTGPAQRRQYWPRHALAGVARTWQHLLNLCHDRYRFAVGFGAGLLRDA